MTNVTLWDVESARLYLAAEAEGTFHQRGSEFLGTSRKAMLTALKRKSVAALHTKFKSALNPTAVPPKVVAPKKAVKPKTKPKAKKKK